MKFKSLLLTAAITAASFSTVAHAEIDGLDFEETIAKNSDLILTIYDTVKSLSYVQVLDGNNYYDLDAKATLGQNFSGSFNLDAAALNIFSTSNQANLVWGMGASNQDFLDNARTGNIITATSPFALDPGLTDAVGQKFWQLARDVNRFTSVGSFIDNYFETYTGSATDTLVATAGAGSFVSTTLAAWSDKASGQVGFENTAGVNVAQTLWYLHVDADQVEVAPYMLSQNQWVLDLNAKTLSSAPVEVAPVPLPAAAWLLVSALMGLGGIARRRNANV